MGYWTKARKDVEELLGHFDQAGWRIEDPPKYYTVKCLYEPSTVDPPDTK